VDLGPAFDRIVTINSAMFWTDLDEGTAHLANLLVPDGIVAIMHQPRLAPATDEEAQKAARKYADSVAKAGLEAIEIRIMESLSPAPVCVLATNSETIY
jgi:hypothetical protein